MRLRHYGVRVYARGYEIHADARARREGQDGRHYVVADDVLHDSESGEAIRGLRPPRFRYSRAAKRGVVTRFSKASARRLEFIAANGAASFRDHVTLTYRASEWFEETRAQRNARVASWSKRDLGRFLNATRRWLGAYLWVMEFQRRGVVHFHLLSSRQLDYFRVRRAWLRAIRALNDRAAARFGVRIDGIANEAEARSYLGRYLGKLGQKRLPEGVKAAGRWWGRSRSLSLAVLREVVSCDHGKVLHDRAGIMVLRGVRRFIRGRTGRKYRGGLRVDWSGEIVAPLVKVVDGLEAFYGLKGATVAAAPERDEEREGRLHELLRAHGWEEIDERVDAGALVPVAGAGDQQAA